MSCPTGSSSCYRPSADSNGVGEKGPLFPNTWEELAVRVDFSGTGKLLDAFSLATDKKTASETEGLALCLLHVSRNSKAASQSLDTESLSCRSCRPKSVCYGHPAAM